MSLRFKKAFSLKSGIHIEGALFLCALLSVVVTLGILGILAVESIPFFKHVGLNRFLGEREWMPLFDEARFGIAPLLAGTLVTTGIALAVAIPAGILVAVFLSEYCSARTREILKPLLELLAAIPTVLYGYFALLLLTPFLQKFIPSLPGFNMLSAGLVMGFMILPYVSSLSEDAMRAVPQTLREGSFSLGATRLQTAFRVVIPASVSGLSSAWILALSRAVGETMIVAIAAGMQSQWTLNPLHPAQTMTAFIVQVSLGDSPHGSLGYQSIFAVGFTLCLMTFFFNVLGFWFRKRYREVYD